MQKILTPARTSNSKLPKTNEGLPSLKGPINSSQLEELSQQQPHQSRGNSKERASPHASHDGALSEVVEDLKRENASLRIKLHEMQAQALENSIKSKGFEKTGGSKGMETTLVRANSKMFQLENIIKQKDDQIQQLSYEKRLLENIRKDQAKAIENLMNDKNYYLKAGQDLQAELTTLKKSTINDLISENKAQKERLSLYEKKLKSDRDLISKQLQTIKLLDEKNTEISRVKCMTLNPLYDGAKRNEIYRHKVLGDVGVKSEVDTIKALNLAFTTDEVLERLLEEQNDELEEEELRKAKAKGENAEVPQKEKKAKDWEREYGKLRATYIETRFEFEHIDTRLKEEINSLAKKLNEVEEKLREKTKEHDMLTQVLDHGKHVNYEQMAQRASVNRSVNLSKRYTHKPDKVVDMSNVGHENENQPSFHDDMREILKFETAKTDAIAEEKEEDRNVTNSDNQEKEEQNEDKEKEKEKEEQNESVNDSEINTHNVAFPGGIVVRLGQFNDGHTFDDQTELVKKGAVAMDSISIWADNKSLLGLQVKYINKNGDTFDGPKHMGEISKDKYAKEPWKIDEGDCLSKVRGAVAVTHGVIWIEFTTKNGVIKKFGKSEIGKESFNFNFKPTEVPLIVMGSFSVRDRGEKAEKLNLSAIGFTSIEKEKAKEEKAKEEKGKAADSKQKEKANAVKGKASEKDAKDKNDVKGKAKEEKKEEKKAPEADKNQDKGAKKKEEEANKVAATKETPAKKDPVAVKNEAKKPAAEKPVEKTPAPKGKGK